MIINEKALIRAMKEAKKAGGYHCHVEDKKTVLHSGGWYVRCLTAMLPRKVLALLVEHMGELPQNGDTWYIAKGEAQKEIGDIMATMTERLEKALYLGELRKTPLTYNGIELWQNCDSTDILGFAPALTGLSVVTEPEIRKTANDLLVMVNSGEVSAVYVAPVAFGPDKTAAMSHLEGMVWVTE